MPDSQNDEIQTLLTRLMQELRQRPHMTAEIARAEREFFHANPTALREDPAAGYRFQEWFLMERESEHLGEIPVSCLPMRDAERESLADSLMGVFLVTGATAAEYTIQDLQDDKIHDLAHLEEFELEPGDVLVGRLFDGPLDVFIPSPALCCQHDAAALAVAFQKDVARLGIDRRLTQSEVEHLMFRGRGNDSGPATATGEDAVPLERLEADLESCLFGGGVTDLSATEISTALRASVRPGPVVNPLLERLAFDTEVDLDRVQKLLLQIWTGHDANRAAQAARVAPQEPADAEPASPPKREPPQPAPGAGDELRGEDLAKRFAEGVEKREDLADVFAEMERMAGLEPDPISFRPDTVDPTVEPPPELEDSTDTVAYEGDLRPLMAEYLWESGTDSSDHEALEQLYRTQCEAAVPRLDFESITTMDVVRTLLQTFLATAPGDRAHAVARSFGVIEEFYLWVEETQQYDIGNVLSNTRQALIEHLPRLEAASFALTGDAESAPPGHARDLARVVHVKQEWIEVAPGDGDELVRVTAASSVCENLRSDDLVLGVLRSSTPGQGAFAGMVIVLPPIAIDLLG